MNATILMSYAVLTHQGYPIGHNNPVIGYVHVERRDGIGLVCVVFRDLNYPPVAEFADLGGDGRRNEARAREVLAQ